MPGHLQSGALSDANFAALGNFCAASKASSHTTIGKFGVGFCGVFHVCDESFGRHWTCDLGSLAARRDAAINSPHALFQPYLATGAVFRFPFRKEVTTTPNGVKFQPAKLKDLGEMFLAAMALPIVLFLNHTRTITLTEVSESGVEKVLSSVGVQDKAFDLVMGRHFSNLTAKKPMGRMTKDFVAFLGKKEIKMSL